MNSISKHQETERKATDSKGTGPRGLFSTPKQDFLASVVVFLVALPLCMGIAIASGVPVAAGLITGIVGGLVVGWIAGAPLQVSGPAAGLTVIIFDLVQKHGLEVLGIAVLIGGVLQLLAGLLRYGRWFRAVSPAVIHGMLAGIGILILSSQFHVMVDDAPKGNGIQNLASIPEAIQKGLPMPELGTARERRAKRDLLQQFGN
jgi:MFS superfamily sulfate permease-like transporter